MTKEPVKRYKTISDVVVHCLFARRKNEALLVSFVNAVLTDSGFPPIKKAKITNPFNPKTFPTEKESVLDIAAEDENSRKIHIEVQILEEDAFVERCVYYNGKVFSSQLIKGEDYSKLKPVISIVLTEFELFRDLNRLHTSFFLMAREVPGYILTEHTQLHFLQLPTNFDEDTIDGVESVLIRWLKFFGFPGKISEKELTLLGEEDKVIAMAIKEYEKFNDDPKLRDLAERREKFLRDVNSSKMTAVRRARAEGKAEGKTEREVEIAISLLKEGLSIEFIAKTTGLSKQEVKKLSKES